MQQDRIKLFQNIVASLKNNEIQINDIDEKIANSDLF